jgi:hypothetical protein
MKPMNNTNNAPTEAQLKAFRAAAWRCLYGKLLMSA